MEKSTAEKVVNVFAILNWVGAAISIIGGLALVLFGSAALSFVGSESIEAAMLVFLLPIIGFGLLLSGIAGAIIGYGLWKRRNWARIAVVIYAVLSVFSVPIGTIIGLLEIWLFGFDKDVKALFGP